MVHGDSASVGNGHEEVPENDDDTYYAPIISLPEVKVPTLEEDENLLISLRAKLYRMDLIFKEWKERGTGEVRMLHNPAKQSVRVVMRRDKTLKICANHYITADMSLKSHNSSQRAWIYTTHADFADEESKAEIFAIMFHTPEIANIWKEMFERAQSLLSPSEVKNENIDDGTCEKSDSSTMSEVSDSESQEFQTPVKKCSNEESKLIERMSNVYLSPLKSPDEKGSVHESSAKESEESKKDAEKVETKQTDEKKNEEKEQKAKSNN